MRLNYTQIYCILYEKFCLWRHDVLKYPTDIFKVDILESLKFGGYENSFSSFNPFT